MKGFLILLLAAALCAERAYSLECFLCLSPTPSSKCTVRTNCSEQQPWCLTTVDGPAAAGYPFGGDRIVVRGCTEHCVASNPNNLGVTRPTFCCQEDLCNTAASGSPNLRASYWALTGIGSFILALLQTIG
ncbi:hypothetical protein FKM82_005725 [Ascaphus truei]